MSQHVLPTFGLPYAAADVDDIGYHVVCPACGLKCRAEGSTGEKTAEDDATKGATKTYQVHFTQAANEQEATRLVDAANARDYTSADLVWNGAPADLAAQLTPEVEATIERLYGLEET